MVIPRDDYQFPLAWIVGSRHQQHVISTDICYVIYSSCHIEYSVLTIHEHPTWRWCELVIEIVGFSQRRIFLVGFPVMLCFMKSQVYTNNTRKTTAGHKANITHAEGQRCPQKRSKVFQTHLNNFHFSQPQTLFYLNLKLCNASLEILYFLYSNIRDIIHLYQI